MGRVKLRMNVGAERRRSAVVTGFVAVAAFLGGVAATGASADAAAPSSAVSFREELPASTFRVSSFNVLGWRHTAPNGDRRGYASGETRMGYANQLLDATGVEVVGFQEMQRQQYWKFKELTGDAWGVYPADALTRIDMHNSVAWRTEKWELVEANTIAIPYFWGMKVQMPYVLLRNIASNRLVWFANFHNPANGKDRGNQARWRAQARSIEIALANRLFASGVPLVMTGDMNEASSYFCGLTLNAPVKSASGGSWGTTRCTPPDAPRIDWIFGSNDVQFTNYEARRGTLVRKATDHPMIIADVTIPSRPRA